MNNLLLDTNVLIWFFEGAKRVNSLRNFFNLIDHRIHISAVSWWEIAIKVRTGKLPIDILNLESFVNEYQFIDLPLTKGCLKTYLELPNLHKDPFDHMLLAQAITYPMRLITGDSFLADYSSLVMVV